MTCANCERMREALAQIRAETTDALNDGYADKKSVERANEIAHAALAPASEPPVAADYTENEAREVLACVEVQLADSAPPAVDDGAVERVHRVMNEARWAANEQSRKCSKPWTADEIELAQVRAAIAALGDPAAHVREVLREVLGHEEVSIHVEKSNGIPTGVCSLTVRVRDRLPADLLKRAGEVKPCG